MLEDTRMRSLAKLLDVSVLRSQIHAANIANQNTPGYRARAVRFDDAYVEAAALKGDDAALDIEPEIYEPQNTMVRNDGNDVSVDKEVTAAAENAMLYRTYIQLLRGKNSIINQAIRPTGG